MWEGNFYRPETKVGTRQCFYTFVSFCSRGGGLYPRGGLHQGGEGGCASGGAASRGGLLPVGVCIWGVGSASKGLGRQLPPYRILWDTVNEQVVCILLECILVFMHVCLFIGEVVSEPPRTNPTQTRAPHPPGPYPLEPYPQGPDITPHLPEPQKRVARIILECFLVSICTEKLIGEKLEATEVSQSEIGQKQKLRVVLDKINRILNLPPHWSHAKWSVDSKLPLIVNNDLNCFLVKTYSSVLQDLHLGSNFHFICSCTSWAN